MSPEDTASAAAATPASSQAVALERAPRRVLRGKVVSDRMQKTITVQVERVFKHPKYKKYIRRNKKYHAHDEDRAARIGDEVEIRECRPLSKLKRWRLVSVIQKAGLAEEGVA